MDNGTSASQTGALVNGAAEASPPSGLRSPSGIEPIVLVDASDPDQKPKLFACPTCGNAYSVRSVGIQSARDMAVNCKDCRPKQYTCDTCGCETPKYWTRCDSCRYEAKLAAAEEVPDDGGPYCAFDGDTYFHSLDEAADAGLEWVSPCHITYPKIDADSVLENLLDDMHEDASVDDLDATAAFYKAVDAFNETQKTQSWFGDVKRKIRVPSQGIEARQGGDGEAGSVHESPVRQDAPND